jgi:peroxiredoxin
MLAAAIGCDRESQTPPPLQTAALTAELQKSPADIAHDDRAVESTPAGSSEDPELPQQQGATPAERAVPDETHEVTPAIEITESAARDGADGPYKQTVFYRLDETTPATMPQVFLSKGDAALCRVKVGDTLPPIELVQAGGERKRLRDLFGKTATVVVFWKSDRRMAHQQLADLGPDVIQPFKDSGIAVVGIAVGESADNVEAVLQRAGADFPNLLDSDGNAFAQVGSERLPRTYLVDPQGKILWFDIEYSLATRRELHQALRAVTGEAYAGGGTRSGGNGAGTEADAATK